MLINNKSVKIKKLRISNQHKYRGGRSGQLKCKETSQCALIESIVARNKSCSKNATNSSGFCAFEVLYFGFWGFFFIRNVLIGLNELMFFSSSSSSGTPVNLGKKTRFQNSGLNEYRHILHLLIARRDHRNCLRVTNVLLALISIPFHSLHRNYSLLSSSIEFSNEK